MGKTKETLIIEDVLHRGLFGANPELAREFGASEVKIVAQKMRKEYVDFLSYDAEHNHFKCYEIKVSMSDFHSKARLSWYGNYNYLVVTEEVNYPAINCQAW